MSVKEPCMKLIIDMARKLVSSGKFTALDLSCALDEIEWLRQELQELREKVSDRDSVIFGLRQVHSVLDEKYLDLKEAHTALTEQSGTLHAQIEDLHSRPAGSPDSSCDGRIADLEKENVHLSAEVNRLHGVVKSEQMTGDDLRFRLGQNEGDIGQLIEVAKTITALEQELERVRAYHTYVLNDVVGCRHIAMGHEITRNGVVIPESKYTMAQRSVLVLRAERDRYKKASEELHQFANDLEKSYIGEAEQLKRRLEGRVEKSVEERDAMEVNLNGTLTQNKLLLSYWDKNRAEINRLEELIKSQPLIPTLLPWICPKCGRGVAPGVSACVHGEVP